MLQLIQHFFEIAVAHANADPTLHAQPVMAFWPLLIAAGLGALSGAAKNDDAKKQEEKDRKLAAETARYSWVTGLQPNEIRHAGSMAGDVLQGAGAGLMQGQNFQSAGAANNLQNAQANYWQNALAQQQQRQPDEYGASMPTIYGSNVPRGRYDML